MPKDSDYLIISGLEWDTEYNVYVVAVNKKGKSDPATISVKTSIEPAAIPGTHPQVTHTATNPQETQELNSKLKTRASCLISPRKHLKVTTKTNSWIFPSGSSHFEVLTERA